MINNSNYLNKLDAKIFPFISNDLWENEYPMYSLLYEKDENLKELAHASESLFHIFNKVVMQAKTLPLEFFKKIKIDNSLSRFINGVNYFNLSSVLTRLDFIKSIDGTFKLLEINADTPCAFIEAYYANKIACDFHKAINPNENKIDDIKNLFNSISSYIPQVFAFSANFDYIEDKATTKFLRDIANQGFFIDLKNLVVKNDGVYFENVKIDVLYMLHPKEMLIQDVSPLTGYPVGIKLLELADSGNLILINPVESIIMQNKYLQALVWELRNKGDFFTEKEKQIIQKYMIPSYFNNSALISKKYIEKPIFGREGYGITIFDENNNIIETTNDHEEDLKDFLYQEYVDSTITYGYCTNGKIEGKITYSNFIINGKSSAFYSRFNASEIAGLDAFWQPIAKL